MDERPQRPRPKFVEKLEARREHHRDHSLVYRVVFGLAGVIVLLAGLVMLVTPGPAFVLIPIGLAMLSMEFAWAASALDKALEKAQAVQDKAGNTSRRQRVLRIVAGLLLLFSVVAASGYWNVGPF